MAPSRLRSLILPVTLCTSTLVHGIWTNDKNLDPKFKCTKNFYDIDPQERIKTSDYEDMTAFCAAASDGRPSMGCSCQNDDGVPQCDRDKADKDLYDTAMWPPGNVSVPIDFSWSCITDCVCGADPDPPDGTPKQKEIQKALSIIAADPVAVSDVRKSVPGAKTTPWQFPASQADTDFNSIECAGPMFDIDAKNQAVQTGDYADLTSVCAANNGKFPNMGFDCSGPGGSLASNATKYDPNLAKYHRPPGNVVQPIIFSQLCNIMCSCPQSEDTISDFANDWWNIWSDGNRTAVTNDGQTVLEYMPNGMPYGAGRSYQYELPAMQADVAAGPNVTNVDLINLNSTVNDIGSILNDTSGSCDATTGACEGDYCVADDDCSEDGSLYCDLSISSCISDWTLSGTGTQYSNETYYCEADTDCSVDGSVTCDKTTGECIIRETSINNGTSNGNDNLTCGADEDCSSDGSAFCDPFTGQCVYNSGGDSGSTIFSNSTGTNYTDDYCNAFPEDCGLGTAGDGSGGSDTGTTIVNGVAEVTFGVDGGSSGTTPTPVAQPGNKPKKLKRRFIHRTPPAPTPAPIPIAAPKALHRRRKAF